MVSKFRIFWLLVFVLVSSQGCIESDRKEASGSADGSFRFTLTGDPRDGLSRWRRLGREKWLIFTTARTCCHG